LVQEVATALQLLHSQKKVHRDLKPGNVLLAQGRWKLADFGLVRQLGPSSYGQTSNPIGTIAFMPPEAFDGKISTAWDLWSLGIMTAGVLTGKLPYDYQDQTRLLKQVMNAAVQIPTLAEPFGSIVRGCLNPDFRQRWTADQVLQALNPAQATQSRWNIDAVPLNSEKRVDYRRLLDLLKARQWKEADHETRKCMERALGTSDWYKIYSQKLLLQLPCADLKTIDQLWVQASRGRYGFSVQKEIYAKCGAKLDGNYPGDAIWYKFCEEGTGIPRLASTR